MRVPLFFRVMIWIMSMLLMPVGFVFGAFLFGTNYYLRYPFSDNLSRINDPIFTVIMFGIALIGGFLIAYPVYKWIYSPIQRWINITNEADEKEKREKV